MLLLLGCVRYCWFVVAGLEGVISLRPVLRPIHWLLSHLGFDLLPGIEQYQYGIMRGDDYLALMVGGWAWVTKRKPMLRFDLTFTRSYIAQELGRFKRLWSRGKAPWNIWGVMT